MLPPTTPFRGSPRPLRERAIAQIVHGLGAYAQKRHGRRDADFSVAIVVKNGDLMTLLSWRRYLPPELMRKQPGAQIAVAWG